MFELVPSKCMRDYFKKVGFEFSDFQKATLIWNARGKTWNEILSTLRELAETTEDTKTRKQVLERIDYEEKVLDTLKTNPSGKYVFVVEDRDDKYSCGKRLLRRQKHQRRLWCREETEGFWSQPCSLLV